MNDVGDIPFGRRHVLIDGYNVLHAVLLADERGGAATDGGQLSWWRPEYQRRVVGWACGLSELGAQAGIGCAVVGDAEAATVLGGGFALTVVFDASREVDAEHRVTSEQVGIVYAPDADDWIVDACRRAPCIVVTADRTLCERARVWGAMCVRPWQVRSSTPLPIKS